MLLQKAIQPDSGELLDSVSEFRTAFLGALKENGKTRIRKTYLMKAYGMFAKILLEKHGRLSSKTREHSIEKLFSGPEIQKANSTGYDPVRYNSLRDLCLNLMKG